MRKNLNKILASFLAGMTTFSSLSMPVLALEKIENNMPVEYTEAETDGTVLFHLTKSVVNLTKNSDNKATGDLGYYLLTTKGNYKTSNTDVAAIPTVTKLNKDSITITADDDASKTINVSVKDNTSREINAFTTAEAKLYRNKLNLKEDYNETTNNKYAGDWTLESAALTNVKAGHYVGSVTALFNIDVPSTVYAKLCDEDNNGTGETLYLSNNTNFSCQGTLKNDYDNEDIKDTELLSINLRTRYNITTVDILNTIKPTNTSKWFYWLKNLKEIKNIANLDTSEVTDMSEMFVDAGSLSETPLTLDLSNFDTSNVTNMNDMFCSAKNLTTIYVSDKFTTNNVTNSDEMFYNTTKLVGGNGTTYDSSHIDKTYARIDKAGQPGYFTYKASSN